MNAPIKRRLRWRRWIAVLVIAIGSVMMSLYVVLATNDGSRWLLQKVGESVPYNSSDIDGNVISGLSIGQLRMELPSAVIGIENASINLDLWPLLFTQELRIASLSIDTLTVTTRPSEQASSDTALPLLPALPVRAVLNKLSLKNIIIDDAVPMGLTLDSLSLIDQRLKWKRVVFTRADLALNSSGEWLANALTQQIKTKTRWSMGSMGGELVGEGPLRAWKLNHSFNAGGALGGGQVFSDGSIQVLAIDDINLTLNNQISGVRGPGWSVASQQLSVNTDLTSFTVSGDIALNSEQAGDVTGNVDAEGTLAEGATVTLDLVTLGGRGQLTSRIDWQPTLTIRGDMQGRGLRLDQLAAWPLDSQAIAALNVRFAAQKDGEAINWQVSKAAIDGVLGDAPLTLEAQANGSPDNIRLEHLFLRHLGNWIESRGELQGQQAALEFSANFSDLSPYRAGLLGDAVVNGNVHTALDNWQRGSDIEVNLISRNLQSGDSRTGGLSLQLSNSGQQLNGQLSADFIHSGDIALEDFKHSLEGDIGRDSVSVAGTGGGQLIIGGQRFPLPSPTSQWRWYRQGESLLDINLQASNDRFGLLASANIDRQQQLRANAELAVTALQWLSDFNPRLETLDGSAQFHAEVSGPLDTPDALNITSQFSVDAPTISLIDPTIRLNDNRIEGALMRDGSFTFSGHAQQGDKPIALLGSGQLLGDDSPTLQFSLNADGLRATTPKVEIAVSPDLNLDINPSLLKVRGSIAVPLADIEVSQLPNPSYSRSEDVVVVGRKAPETSTTLQQDIDVTLRLDDKVVIKAAGLATKLRGELRYSSVTGRPAHLQGKLDLVDGSLSSQSGDLSIKRGSLIFSGSTDNPGVDIIAVRKIDSPAIEVGLHITGTLKDLRTAIVSIPAIDQTKALSYLVFGRDITQDDGDSGNSNAQLMSAAISLGIGQSSSLMQNLKRSTGLDELAAVANDSGSASLIAGKQINSRLYARYRYDMAEALGVLLLRYRLSQRWTLEAESGADNSVDVLYRLGD